MVLYSSDPRRASAPVCAHNPGLLPANLSIFITSLIFPRNNPEQSLKNKEKYNGSFDPEPIKNEAN